MNPQAVFDNTDCVDKTDDENTQPDNAERMPYECQNPNKSKDRQKIAIAYKGCSCGSCTRYYWEQALVPP